MESPELPGGECLNHMPRCLQGAVVDGPVPAPDLAPAVPARTAPAMAPAPSAPATNPLSFLVNVRPRPHARKQIPMTQRPWTMPLLAVEAQCSEGPLIDAMPFVACPARHHGLKH